MDRQFLIKARLLAGVVTPLLVLLVDSFIAGPHKAAVVAGGLSVFMLTLFTVMLGNPNLSRFSYVPSVLLWTAAPIGLVAWGRGMPLLVAALLVLTPGLTSCALKKRRSPTFNFCTLVHAGVLAYLMYSSQYVNWVEEAAWAGWMLLISVAVHVGGLLIARKGFLPAFFLGVCLSGLPVAILLWGLGAPVPGLIGGAWALAGAFGLSQTEKLPS